jgi:hypothetical protein
LRERSRPRGCRDEDFGGWWFVAERAFREIKDELARARARLRLSDPERVCKSH